VVVVAIGIKEQIMKSPVQLFVAIAVLLATATVAAQVYKWVDKDGQVQYAAKVEPKKIANASASTSAATTAAPTATGKPGDTAKTSKDKAKDSAKEVEKRRKEEIEKNLKDDDIARVAKANQERCKGATVALLEFESGRPINRIKENGEREFVSDDERAASIVRMRAAMTESCK